MTERPGTALAALIELCREFGQLARGRIALASMTMISGAALEGFNLALVVPLVALALGHRNGTPAIFERAAATIGVVSLDRQLFLVLAIFVLVMTLRATILATRDRILNDLQIGFVDHQRTQIIQALASSRWQDIVALRHARITHALGGEVARTATALHLLLAIISSAIMLFAQWLVVLFLSRGLGLLAILVLPLAAAGTLPMLRRAGLLGHALKGGHLVALDTATQLLGGLKPALAQNMQMAFVAEFARTLDDLAARQRDFVRAQGKARVLATAGAAVALSLAVLSAHSLALPAARLVASLAVFARMFGPAMTLLRSAQQIAGVLPSSAGLMTLKRELQQHAGPIDAQGAAVANGPIRLTDVSYDHARNGNGKTGIRDLTVTIEPGEIVGVSGISGAGKTSFVDLLCGLIIPDSGHLHIGDLLLDQQHLGGWRRRIAYVAQETYVFHDSVRRNLGWGLAEVSEDDLWRALDLVEASAVVRRLDAGLDAIVGERGALLSGGERQRLALARAVLRSPALLILDEATNALDLATEQRVLGRIASLDPACTVILVSHRPEALAICRRMLTFDAGRLVRDERLPRRSA